MGTWAMSSARAGNAIKHKTIIPASTDLYLDKVNMNLHMSYKLKFIISQCHRTKNGPTFSTKDDLLIILPIVNNSSNMICSHS